MAAMTEKHTKAAEKLWMELAEDRAHPHAECTADEVAQQAAGSQEAMGNVLTPRQRRSKSEGGRDMESSTIRNPSGRHDHGGLNRQ